LETLLTTPVTTFEVILGKFTAAYFLYLLLWGSTGAFFYILRRFADGFDYGPLIGGYLFIAVSGLFFIAIGIFASSLARNQAVAGILSFTMLFVLTLGLHFLQDLTALNHEALAPFKMAVENAQVFRHLDDFSRGIVDLRQLLFYVSGSVLCLIFSIFSVEAKLIHS
jgi:ABC-2 type transport system permease protein